MIHSNHLKHAANLSHSNKKPSRSTSSQAHSHIMQLQKAIGNRAMTQLMRSSMAQAESTSRHDNSSGQAIQRQIKFTDNETEISGSQALAIAQKKFKHSMSMSTDIFNAVRGFILRYDIDNKSFKDEQDFLDNLDKDVTAYMSSQEPETDTIAEGNESIIDGSTDVSRDEKEKHMDKEKQVEEHKAESKSDGKKLEPGVMTIEALNKVTTGGTAGQRYMNVKGGRHTSITFKMFGKGLIKIIGFHETYESGSHIFWNHQSSPGCFELSSQGGSKITATGNFKGAYKNIAKAAKRLNCGCSIVEPAWP